MVELLLIGALAATAGSAAAPEPPELVFEAPAELERLAARLEGLDRRPLVDIVRLTGARAPGPAIRVVLAPEESAPARRAPPWVSGYAFGAEGVVVLLPERVPRYPHRSLEDLLWHEVAHVLVARAAGGRPVPRWFNEGVAMLAGRTWGLEDRGRALWHGLAGDPVSLAELEPLFAGERGEAARAYALSGSFVRDLIHRDGPEVVAAILGWTAMGLGFEEAVVRATGTPLAQLEAELWGRHARWDRWILFLTSSAVLWVAVTLLALWAARRRRARSARQRELWELEEAASAPPEPVAPERREWIN